MRRAKERCDGDARVLDKRSHKDKDIVPKFGADITSCCELKKVETQCLECKRLREMYFRN